MIVSIGMGIVDVKAPEIIAEPIDHYVAPGTKITLTNDGIADYLSISDDSAFTTSYSTDENSKEDTKDTGSWGAFY